MRILKVSKTELLPLFVLATLGLQLLSVIWQAANTLAIHRESNKEVPTLVQLADGRAIGVKTMGNTERSPQTVSRFVSETLTLMFNWSGKLPSTDWENSLNPKPDPGVKIGKSSTPVTTASWQASFALSEDFRASFLEKVAQLTPRDVLFGDTQAVLIIRHTSQPEPLETGRWKVQVIGDLILFNSQDRAGNAIPFNKEVFVRAVTKPVMPLAESASILEKTIYRIREAGLEIYAIRELKRENL